jgi:hypothetical protein
MARILAAQLGLLAFSVAIIAGLLAGNSFNTIVTRAIVALFVAALAGQLAGWAGRLVLRDHLLQRKLKIDREHHEKRGAGETEGPAREKSTASATAPQPPPEGSEAPAMTAETG